MRYIVLSTAAVAAICLAGSTTLAADGKLGVEIVERDGKVVILNVIAGSGAAGVLEAGDILYKVGTTKISSIQDALDAKTAADNNKDIPFIILRNGDYYDFNGRFEKGEPYGKYSKPVLRKKKK